MFLFILIVLSKVISSSSIILLCLLNRFSNTIWLRWCQKNNLVLAYCTSNINYVSFRSLISSIIL